MACRVPGAADLRQFWQLLVASTDAIQGVPQDRWTVPPDGRGPLAQGGFLDHVADFDPRFFGISPREAPFVDPLQRLALELAWEAFEDAGLPPETLTGSATGVFAGAMASEYARLLGRQALGLAAPATHLATGQDTSLIANRVSYVFGLEGPSLVVNSSSSSSLVAIHLACQSLRAGECTLALAGGVSLALDPLVAANLARSGATSADGRSRAFDQHADGYGRGEGGAFVVLKPLAAVTSHDRVYVVIRGSAVNNDGRADRLTAPSQRAQEALLRAAYAQAGIAPHQVQAVEAHGTGTPLGDATEAAALGSVLGQGRAAGQPLLVGSVKSNIGHLEAAAGVAGFVKMALALHHGQMPASLHFRQPPGSLPLDDWHLTVPTGPVPWPDQPRPPVGGVSAFGIGGTNCHVVLEAVVAPPATPRPNQEDHTPHLLVLTTGSEHTLRTLAARTATAVAGAAAASPPLTLADWTWTAATRRTHRAHRLAVVAHTLPDLVRQLRAWEQGVLPSGAWTGKASAPRPLAFVFSGQGAQWLGMGQRLYQSEPVFRERLQACDRVVRAAAGWSLVDALGNPDPTQLQATAAAQPWVVALQIALAALWRAWGIEPSAVVGHSVGEVAAAHVAGALSLEEAMTLAVTRGQVMEPLRGHGELLAVESPPGAIEHVLATWQPAASIAAINAPDALVLAARPEAVDRLTADLRACGATVRPLGVPYPFHSAAMAPAAAALLDALEDTPARSTRLPMASTVEGQMVRGWALDRHYWARNVSAPVQFARAIEQMVLEGYRTFVEVGPHATLTRPITQVLAHARVRGQVVTSLRRDADERTTLLSALGALFVEGYPVQWPALFSTPGKVAPLPHTPYSRQRYWLPAPADEVPPPAAEKDFSAPPAAVPRTWNPEQLATVIATHVAAVLHLDTPRDIDHDTGFHDLGLDSHLALELCARIERETGVSLPATATFDHPTVRTLAQHVSGTVQQGGSEAPEPGARMGDPADGLDLLRRIEGYSDDQVDALLADKGIPVRGGDA